MRWGAPSIATFADRAGFAGDDLAVAVAVALASTGGDDAFEYGEPWGAQRRYVGLWAIDATTYPELAGHELLNPRVNARAARHLWVLDDGGWSWTFGFTGGGWRKFTDDAEEGVRQMGRSEVAQGYDETMFPGRGLLVAAEQGRRAVGRVVEAVRAVRRGR